MNVRIAALAAALIVALSLAACGGDDDEGTVVEGTGYEVTVPDGWDDESEAGEDIEVQGARPDMVLIGERDDGFSTNVNVIRTGGVELGLDAQMRLERRLLERGGPPGADDVEPARELTPLERTTLGDEDARAHELQLPQRGRMLRLRQVFAIRESTAYVITLTATPDRFDEDRESFETILDSWRWR